MQKLELGEHFDSFLQSQFLEIKAVMAFWALAWQKTSSVKTWLAFYAQKPL
jgi:hypothetical protein